MPDASHPLSQPPPFAVPREPLVDVASIHPALEKMARAICLAEGHNEDEHWFDYNPKRKVDLGGPAWTAYLEHATQALQVLETLDFSTLMRGTAALNYDDAPPPDDLGDTDTVPDLARMLRALVAHIKDPAKPAARPTVHTTWDEKHYVQRREGGAWSDIDFGYGDVAQYHSLALARTKCAHFRRGEEAMRIVTRRFYSLTEDTITEVPA